MVKRDVVEHCSKAVCICFLKQELRDQVADRSPLTQWEITTAMTGAELTLTNRAIISTAFSLLQSFLPQHSHHIHKLWWSNLIILQFSVR